MKITNIQPIRNYTYNKKNTNNHLTKTNYKPINLNYYPVFLGGYSLDLSMVNKNLKKEEFPPDILELVQLILKNNPNPQNKTLYDIHFEKYKNILECYSLEELKETYPEFKDVISVFDVEAEKNSFIGEFLEEKSDNFYTEEDLTLQLIKLYGGQG